MCLVGAQGEGAAAALSGEEELAVAAVAALGAAAAVSESGGGAAARGRWHIPPRPFVLWLAHPVPCPTDSCRSLGSRASSSPPKNPHTHRERGGAGAHVLYFSFHVTRGSRGRGPPRLGPRPLAHHTHTSDTRHGRLHMAGDYLLLWHSSRKARKHAGSETRDAKVKRTLIHPVEPDLRIKLIGRRRARVEATGASGLRQP